MPEHIRFFLCFLPCIALGIITTWFGIHWYRGGTKGKTIIFGKELPEEGYIMGSWEKFFYSVIAVVPFIFLITDLSIFQVLPISHRTTELLIYCLMVPMLLFIVLWGTNVMELEDTSSSKEGYFISFVYFLHFYSVIIHLVIFLVFDDPELKFLQQPLVF